MQQLSADTSLYRYLPRYLIGDYLRAGAGLAFALVMLATATPSPAVLAIFGTLGLLFAAYILRTLRQQVMRVAVNGEGIFTRAFGRRALPWAELSQLKLRYFGTRRQRKQSSGGFMQLTLRGGGRKLSFDSSIEGFRDIAWHAARAARENGVTLDPATAGNLLEIGVNADEATPRPKDDDLKVQSG